MHQALTRFHGVEEGGGKVKCSRSHLHQRQDLQQESPKHGQLNIEVQGTLTPQSSLCNPSNIPQSSPLTSPSLPKLSPVSTTPQMFLL